MSGDDQLIDGSQTRLARKLPAGMFDAGLASMATFAIGIAAANLLSPTELGVYAIFFTAFMFGTVLPRNLIFVPAEIVAVSRPVALRMRLLTQSVRLGIPVAVLGASAVFIAAAITWRLTEPEVVIALVVTTGITAMVSPIQDHIRKLFHIADHSWSAASVSIVQVVAAGITVGIMIQSDVPAAWIPFGALAIANTASLSIAWILALRLGADQGRPPLRRRELFASGKWIVVQAAIPSVAGFIVATVIVWLAGAEALGHAEAARVVAQPVIVLATGLTSVLAPRAMEASMDVNLGAARRVRRIYLTMVVLAGGSYLAIAGSGWSLNPMEYLVPAAYAVPGLVAFTVIMNTFTASEFLQINEILGAKRERGLARIAATTSPILVVTSFSAGITGAFARPLSGLIESWARLWVQSRLLHRHYAEDAPETATDFMPAREVGT